MASGDFTIRLTPTPTSSIITTQLHPSTSHQSTHHQSTNPPIYQSTNPPIYQSTHPPIHQSTHPPIYQSTPQDPMRFFNTAGPVNCQIHYCVPPLQRFDLNMVLTLIGQQKYFVLHAPRQVGKTTYLLALMEYLNRQDHYAALYVNVETAQAAREDVDAAMQAILSELGNAARIYLGDHTLEALWPDALAVERPVSTHWAMC
ncbi:MAG: hypothetical protein V9H69_12695 [Anaerolineae bacterium]